MSLTSYRAAPPRVGDLGEGGVWGGLEDLAATYSPATWVAVPWALGVFTAEFGMGSGARPPPEPPGRPAHPCVWAVGGVGSGGVCAAVPADGGRATLGCGSLLCVMGGVSSLSGD